MGLQGQGLATGCGYDLDVLHRVEDLKLVQGCTITPELVRVRGRWDSVFIQQSAEEKLGCLGVAVTLKEDVQHSAIFIYRSPQPV